MTRMQAMDGLANTIMGRYISPLFGDTLVLRMIAGIVKDAPSLYYLEKPRREHSIQYGDEVA
jgi:hypothetical protein